MGHDKFEIGTFLKGVPVTTIITGILVMLLR
jgi:hypothetical protein